MFRLTRIVVSNHFMHIMHRGNNRQDLFESEEDMTRIKEDIAHALSKSDCYLQADPLTDKLLNKWVVVITCKFMK